MVRFAWAAALSLAIGGQVWAAGTGSFEGQYVLEGNVPAAVPLVKQGDATIKDAAVCAVNPIPDDAMSFDPTSKGIANAVVYMRRAPSDMPAELKTSSAKEVVFDQKDCRFIPYILPVRVDQTVVCKSDDSVAHNVHTNPLANNSENKMVLPNDRVGINIAMPQVENLPIKVQCDIHPWMVAWWVVTDHPYVAVTDKDGKFKIDNLPEGKHEFRVWHEKAGYLDRKLVVEVKGGKTTTLKPAGVALSKFQK